MDRSITFETPPAYLSTIDLKETPKGPGRIGYLVFSESFEPARPVEIEAEKLRLAGASPAEQNRLFQRTPRERKLQFEISNYWLPPDERQALFWGTSGLTREREGRPCTHEMIDGGRFLKLSVPPGLSAFESCLWGPGSAANGYNILRVLEDGSFAYVVKCGSDGPAGKPIYSGGNCTLAASYDGWPITSWFHNKDQGKWDEWHSKIQDFLRHAAKAGDRSANADSRPVKAARSSE